MESPATREIRPARQRKKGSSRLWRWAIIGVPATLVCLLLAVVGLRWWLGRFLRSDDFRRFLDRKASAALQAEAHIDPLHWEGSEVYTSAVNVRGSPGGPLTAFGADQVRAAFDFGALWRRVWRVDTLDVERISAELGPDTTQKTAPSQPSPDKVVLSGDDRHPLGFLLPNRMDIGEVRIADFSLKWTNDQPGTAGQLDNVRLSARMLGNVKTWEVEGHGGTLSQSNLPTVAMDDFALKSTEETVFITRANGHPKNGGTLQISGKQALNATRDLDLTLNLDGVPVEPFLPPDWRGRLHGKATANVRVSGSPLDAKSWQSSGHVELREGQLEALPVLDQLALFSSTVRFRQAVVQKGSADFTWTPDLLTVRNVVIESDGLLRMEGDFTVRAQQIDGTFRVGVAISSVRWIGQISATVFNLPTHDGYAWTTMRISGPVNNPREDLTARLATTAEQAVARKAREGTDAVLDTASSLLDLLKPH